MTSEAFNNAVGPRKGKVDAALQRKLFVGFLLLLLVSMQIATQVCAADFGYQPQLGEHVSHVYPPWAIITWASQWGEQYSQAFQRAASIGFMFSSIGLLVLVAIKMSATNKNAYLHGSARWANRDDIEQAGLLPRKGAAAEGVYVGAWVDKGKHYYLRHAGPEHILTYAPTRSGKGVGLVVPTLLSWPHSALITDIKGELWELTAGWRHRGAKNKVLRFEPAGQNTVRWNPLDEIRIGTEYEVGDVQNLATLLVDPNGKGLESHWDKTAQALLVGVILHTLYVARTGGARATLAAVDQLLADPERPIKDLWYAMIENTFLDGLTHAVIAAAGRDMLDRPEEEAGSVLSTAKSFLALYRDPTIAKNTATSDFRLRDLMHADNAMSLYLVTHPTDKDRLMPFIRIVVNMTIRTLADKIGFEGGHPKALYKHRLLLMLDEFLALRKLPILQESLAFLAGYGIKAYLICQDIEQLKSDSDGYGRNETITSNSHVQVAFPPNRLETAEHLSRMTGQTTVEYEQITRGPGALSTRSRANHWAQRSLLTADEVLRLPSARKSTDGSKIEKPGDMLVFVAGRPAIYGQQPLYFQDETFIARSKLPAPKEPSA